MSRSEIALVVVAVVLTPILMPAIANLIEYRRQSVVLDDLKRFWRRLRRVKEE
jgi:hypothetical protein